MQVTYTKTFLKDLAKVTPVKRRQQIEKYVFEELLLLSSIESSGNIEKMTGYKNLYKVRFGDYRVGLLKSNNTIELQRVLNRKEIYRFFP
ncbi:MAG: type II toxin-antitoxin system RelE family toxin [Chitinophagaceae bacterium]